MLHRAAAYCFYISSVSALYGWDRLLSKETIVMWITAKLLFLVMMDAIGNHIGKVYMHCIRISQKS